MKGVRRKPSTEPGQIWLVIYEDRLDAIRISADNKGFFAPGQEPLWAFSAVQEWVKCLHPTKAEREPELKTGAKGKAWWTRK